AFVPLHSSGTPNRLWVWTRAVAIIAILIVIAVILRPKPPAAIDNPASRINSIAVLPLENLTGDAAQDYFAAGMTEELINNLSKVSSLRVISRTSAMQYKGVHKPLPEIARELRVDAIVEGAVQRSGDHVR